jgi:hypothetical protein
LGGRCCMRAGPSTAWQLVAASLTLASFAPRAAHAQCGAKKCSDAFLASCANGAQYNRAVCEGLCKTKACTGQPCNRGSAALQDIYCCECEDACLANFLAQAAFCTDESGCPSSCSCTSWSKPNLPLPMSLFGTCCSPGQLYCNGCMSPCSGQRILDPAQCTCVCPTEPCGPGRTRNPVTCACDCVPIPCPSGKLQSLTTCGCECPQTGCPGRIQDPSTCACVCKDDLTDCGGTCVDTTTDRANCGGCGKACLANEDCCASMCTRIDLPENCGGCGKKCPTGSNPKWGCCNRACAPLNTKANCGACSVVCKKDCQTGTCICTPPTTDCAGLCKDLKTDPLNCGACGKRCPATAGCQDGGCVCSDSAETICDDTCRNLKTDVKNCGACGNQCQGGSGCSSDNPPICTAFPPACNGSCICAVGWYQCGPDWCAKNAFPVCCPTLTFKNIPYACEAGAHCCNTGGGCCQ